MLIKLTTRNSKNISLVLLRLIKNNIQINMIIDKVNELFKLGFGLDYNSYLTKYKKELIVFKIDRINKKYLLKEGNNFEEILENANIRFVDSEAGYSVDTKTNFSTTYEADILLLSETILNSSLIELETIIIHELTHLIILNSQQITPPLLSKAAIKFGNQIYNLTDKDNEWLTEHTQEFCQYLAEGCIRYNNETRNFANALLAIKSAMRFDLVP